MSGMYKDPYRRVSKPTEADFARGIAAGASKHKNGANFIWAIAAGILVGKAIRRIK